MKNYKWYFKLNKSKLTPPNWVFGVVWPILYILMLISLIIVWTDSKCAPFCMAIVLFFIQLFFNIMWTRVFFSEKNIKLSLFILISTLFFTIFTFIAFYYINKIGAYLLIPYILWLSFAFYLNWYIVKHN